ncbi:MULTISPECIES: PTS sugar transporter subunit IIB [Enterobacteriaceae]|uniref:PTS sugar transporter subunit IIB n=1 Tax=Enterobacteriaceae TaxID=543 RepID=UPI000E835E67|nr:MULTISPECIES: PTS sugar transporter subunit IIB [Enterobacteriaceae]HAZ75803.1 PTS sugar transporter subunit IIB [Enterobacteriaceae bacterium]
MKNIVLCCAAGMSTSMLVQRMKEAAQKKGVEVSIKAVPVSEFKENLAEADIILLGPQVKYEQAKLQAQADPLGKKVTVIDMMDYGMMKGDVVLDKALKLLES